MEKYSPLFSDYLNGNGGVNPNVFHPSYIFENIRHGQSKIISKQIQLHNEETDMEDSMHDANMNPPQPIESKDFQKYFADI